MPNRAIAVVEDQETMSTSILASQDAMSQRTALAGQIRDRMAKPATLDEQSLWLEFKAEVEKGRLTFRS